MKTPLPPGFPAPDDFLEAFCENAGGLVAYIDLEERMRFATQAFADWFGTTREALAGRKLSQLYTPEAYAQFAPWVKRALQGEEVQYERQAQRPDGSEQWISVNLRPHRDHTGRVVGLFSCELEVKELKRTHDALGRALEEIATHIQNTPLAVVEWSSQIRVKRWSPQAQAIFGWTTGEVLGKTSIEIGLVHPESLGNVRGLTRELLDGSSRRNRMLARNLTRDGRIIWVEWYNSAFFEDGRLASILSFAEDVTARVEAEEQLRHAAVNDALTGLPNRNSLVGRLEHAILRVNRSGDRIALLFIDLNRFKKVNDTLGHAAGDEVLRQAAARIRACVREVDTVARLGGDEFVVLLENDVRADTPGIIAGRVRAAFDVPFEWQGAAVNCGASLGVSLYPDHARDPAALIASADMAMYRMKAGIE